ncbi:hypothetical protein EGW08_020003 [Elysia chlorotica]|uniref:Major facilitator superfamily (MFS) profile domain-containing protein n=1 Tax=Elysia chlorotica TaxID=188477 RepID=A0A3S0Z784_ELYCH|nr:hypothetical protein EGW08_020003 [Elysia chlorotica]
MSLGKPPLPVDQGWAWLVMVASFINITIVISFNRASGLFVTSLLEQFQESATSTTVAFGAAPLMFCLSNILLPSALLPRFCSRTLVFTGGVISGISVTCMAFAQSMLALTFLFGIMGFAHGLIFVPQTVLIGLYFKKRLAFANAFAYMGMAAAAIFSPIIARFLLDVYGLQGTLLIYGAFTFNILTAALFLRPINSYKIEPTDIVLVPDDLLTHNEHSLPLLNGESTQPPEHKIATASQNDYVKYEFADSIFKSNNKNHREHTMKLDRSEGKTNEIDGHKNNGGGEIGLQITNFEEPSPKCEYSVKQKNSVNVDSPIEEHLEVDNQASHDKDCNLTKRDNNTQDSCVVCAPIPPSSVDPNEPTVSLIENHTHPSNTNPEKNSLNRCFGGMQSRLRGSVYCNPLAVLLLLAAGLCVHTQPSLTYLPSLGEENGLSSSQVPYLLTAAGVANLLGKLVIGYIADLGLCNARRIYIVIAVNVALGAVFHFIRLCQSFGLMLWLSMSLGTLSGVVDFMFPVLVSDILGKEHIGHMMSGFLLANGVFMSTDHVIVGALKDATGFFYVSYHYMGALTLIGSVCFIIVPVVARFRGEKNERDGMNRPTV